MSGRRNAKSEEAGLIGSGVLLTLLPSVSRQSAYPILRFHLPISGPSIGSRNQRRWILGGSCSRRRGGGQTHTSITHSRAFMSLPNDRVDFRLSDGYYCFLCSTLHRFSISSTAG